MTYLFHVITTYRRTRRELLADITPSPADAWPYAADCSPWIGANGFWRVR